jgi:hypothetical protein
VPIKKQKTVDFSNAGGYNSQQMDASERMQQLTLDARA